MPQLSSVIRWVIRPDGRPIQVEGEWWRYDTERVLQVKHNGNWVDVTISKEEKDAQ